MGDRQAKDALFDAFAEVAKALGNGRRAELIDVLAQGERHVDELAAEIGQSVANTSFHLRALATAGLVTTRRDGTRIYYRLASDRVGELWAALRDVTAAHHEQLDELAAAYLGDRSRLEQIGRDELAERIAAGDVVVDRRPPRPSTPPDTSPAPARSRSTGSPPASRTSPTGSRSSPTAAARTACSPTTPSRRAATAAATFSAGLPANSRWLSGSEVMNAGTSSMSSPMRIGQIASRVMSWKPPARIVARGGRRPRRRTGPGYRRADVWKSHVRCCGPEGNGDPFALEWIVGAHDREPAPGSHSPAEVGERRAGIIEEHDPEAADHCVEGRAGECVCRWASAGTNSTLSTPAPTARCRDRRVAARCRHRRRPRLVPLAGLRRWWWCRDHSRRRARCRRAGAGPRRASRHRTDR